MDATPSFGVSMDIKCLQSSIDFSPKIVAYMMRTSDHGLGKSELTKWNYHFEIFKDPI